MKKFLLMGLVAFSIMVNAQSDPNLKWLHPSPHGWDINWLKMWDTNNWYLAGGYGLFMKTTDGGQTWTTNNKAGWPDATYPNMLTNYHASTGWFFDQNNGIIFSKWGILKTTNGGDTFDTLRLFQPVSPYGKATVKGVYFVNPNLGFICGAKGGQFDTQVKILKTTDGGNTWEELPNLPDPVDYTDVFATSESNITACTANGYIYKTTDGGLNWYSIQLTSFLYDLEFVNDTVGYVCGQNYFKSTTDGGFTWTGGVNPPSGGLPSFKIKAVNNEVYVVGNHPFICKSTDGGESWSTHSLPAYPQDYRFIRSIDVVGSTVVAGGGNGGGNGGNIYKSTDGGGTITSLTQRLTDWGVYSSLYVGTSGKIIGAGNYSHDCIIYSNDWGASWDSSSVGGGAMHRLQMFDDNNGYFVGNNGYFGKTTNGGINLTPYTVPISGGKNFYNLDFIDQNHGWLVGGPDGPGTSIIAKTTDGGATWIDQSPFPLLSGRIKGVDMVDANIGYFGHATVYKTTDGGTTWVPLTVAPGIEYFEKVKAWDANNVYALGMTTSTNGVGLFYKTTDGGTTWSLVPTPLPRGLFLDQDWVDMNHGVIVGTLGLILKTSDGGTNWTIMNTGGWTLYDAQMISADNFYVAGGNGQIIRYGDAPPVTTTFQLTVNVANGWNMVSAPGLLPTNQNVTSWWPGKDPSASVFKFAGGYQSVTAAEPGLGYWMKNLTAQTYNTGDEWPAGGIQIVAHNPIAGVSGWNLFGGYEQSVSAAGVTTTPAGLISGVIYKYTPGSGYQTATTLDPGYGYWAKMTGAGVINIPSGPAGPSKLSGLSTEGFGKITITDKTQKSYTLYAAHSNNNLSEYELPPYPPQGMFDVRYSTQRYAENISTPQEIEMTGVQYPVKVKAEGTGIILTDESGREIARLKTGEGFTITTPLNKLFVSGDVVPREYSLDQNYPNPFNPSTTIQFSIPEDVQNVKLIVYNTLGQKVTELVNTQLKAGIYNVNWNASNVASGLYIYQIATEKFVSTKKMMLLK